MKFEFYDPKIGSLFGFTDGIKNYENQFASISGNINILWNRNDAPVEVIVDDIRVQLLPHQLLTSTYLHHVSYETTKTPLTAFLFNREFYCIDDHDSEVSCNGILFFGTQNLPLVSIPALQKH